MPRPRTPDSTPVYPYQRRIAERLAADPALLNLRTRRLVADVMVVAGVCEKTARVAVAEARRMVRP